MLQKIQTTERKVLAEETQQHGQSAQRLNSQQSTVNSQQSRLQVPVPYLLTIDPLDFDFVYRM
eukprot:COSAG06_NODE_8840_length_2056_cov_1.814001_2_plen_63_part_00